MRIVGLVVEYNPLHNGHVHHFQEAKRLTGAEAVIAVMSGPFLQRGEPAIASKWARAEMALHMGADVVIELPVAFSAQPAEWFAYGAVSALEATGLTDAIVFGSESGVIHRFQELAERLYEEPVEFRDLLRAQLVRGIGYPAAYAAATAAFVGGSTDEGLLVQPNDILGLHYCLALRRIGSRMVPLTIARTGAGYHEREAAGGALASATAIRRLLMGGVNSLAAAGAAAELAAGLAAARPFIPAYTHDILQREWAAGRGPIDWERFAAPLLHVLLTRSPQDLVKICEVTEGLEHRIKGALPTLDYEEGNLVQQLLDAIKTKRYTSAKLQRTLLRILLDHSKADLSREVLSKGVPYLRILGFSTRGRQLLKQMKSTASVPIVIKATKETSPLLTLDLRAAAIYALSGPVPESRELFRDYYQAPLQSENYNRAGQND
ncbi:MAG: nucleotidyltransferase [Gorillibacterium sp.]|nr:nucleotidyltransferase [Gorillibacterium sp.]